MAEHSLFDCRLCVVLLHSMRKWQTLGWGDSRRAWRFIWSSQLPPASPPPLYFPWGSGMDCFDRFTTSSGSRCHCCDYVLSQGSHSRCAMITDSFSRGKKKIQLMVRICQLHDLKKRKFRFDFAFSTHTALKAVCQEFGNGPKSCVPNPSPVLVTSHWMCIHFHVVKVIHCKNPPSKPSFICFVTELWLVSRIVLKCSRSRHNSSTTPRHSLFQRTSLAFWEIHLLFFLATARWDDCSRSHIHSVWSRSQPLVSLA